MSQEQHFALLMSEKALADSTIGAYPDLSLKVISLFGVGTVLLGWLHLDKKVDGPSQAAGYVLIVLAIIACGIIVQGVLTYALTLGYIQHKNKTLNEAFRQLLDLPEWPLTAVDTWRDGEARAPVTWATLALSAIHQTLIIACIAGAFWHLDGSPSRRLLVGIAIAIDLLTIATQLTLARAMKRVLIDG